MDHLTQFAMMVPVHSNAADTVAYAIIARIISIFGPPETLHLDQGTEFQNEVLDQLKKVFGHKNDSNDSVSAARKCIITTCKLHHAEHVGHA